MVELLRGEVVRSRQQERHMRSLSWRGMICELVGVVEQRRMNEDQVSGCREWADGDRVDWRVRYVMRVIFEDDAIMDLGSQCNCFRQSVLLRVWLRRTGLASLFVCVARNGSKKQIYRKEWTCSLPGERESRLPARAEVVSAERSGRICRKAQTVWLHDLTMKAEGSLKLRWGSPMGLRVEEGRREGAKNSCRRRRRQTF